MRAGVPLGGGDELAGAAGEMTRHRSAPVLVHHESDLLSRPNRERVGRDLEGQVAVESQELDHGLVDRVTVSPTAVAQMHPHRADLVVAFLDRPGGDEPDGRSSLHEHDGELTIVEVVQVFRRVAGGRDLGLVRERVSELLEDLERERHGMDVDERHDDSPLVKNKQPPTKDGCRNENSNRGRPTGDHGGG